MLQSHCETTGGQLASIHTADQNEFVVQCVQSMSAGRQPDLKLCEEKDLILVTIYFKVIRHFGSNINLG